MILENAFLIKETIPLKKPYVLSFCTLYEFVSIRLKLQIEGKIYESEVVPLYGYNDLTEENIFSFLNEWILHSIGKNIIELRAFAAELIKEKSFQVSPILSAIDLYYFNLFQSYSLPKLEFVIPFSYESFKKIKFNNENEYKFKLTSNIGQNIEVLESIKKMKMKNPLRVDANQIFSLQQAISFFSLILEKNLHHTISYIEQPLASDNWKAIKSLKNKFPTIPLMLDESIIADEDILRAYEYGVEFIKLKLFKQGGIKETINQAQMCKSLGIKVVIGNGVATSISNKIENIIYCNFPCFYGASEANGFLKII